MTKQELEKEVRKLNNEIVRLNAEIQNNVITIVTLKRSVNAIGEAHNAALAVLRGE